MYSYWMTSTDFKMVKGHDPFVLATILHPSIKPIIDNSLFKDHQTLKHKLLLHVQIGFILQICTCIQMHYFILFNLIPLSGEE